MYDLSDNSMRVLVELHRLELQAQFYLESGNCTKALELYQRILNLKADLKSVGGHVGGRCRAMFEVGKLYHNLGRSEDGWRYHGELLKLLDNLSGNRIKLDFYKDLRTYYVTRGDLEAVSLFNQRIKEELS